MTNEFLKSQLTNGSFQDPSGNPLSNGYLVFTLSHDENISVLGSSTGQQVLSGISITIRLDANGNCSPNQYIWANSLLTPSGSYYKVKAYNNSGLEVWNAPQYYVLTYAATIDLGSIQPTQP